MNDGDSHWRWHDQRGVTWAAGVAAVALIGLLVFAVIRTGSGSAPFPEVGPAMAPDVTSESAQVSRSTSTATSYPQPSVQTTELGPSPAPPVSTGDQPPPDDPAATTTVWTPTNPYVTTTTQNGGAV